MAVNLEQENRDLKRRIVTQSLHIQELNKRIERMAKAIDNALLVIRKGEEQWCSDSQGQRR